MYTFITHTWLAEHGLSNFEALKVDTEVQKLIAALATYKKLAEEANGIAVLYCKENLELKEQIKKLEKNKLVNLYKQTHFCDVIEGPGGQRTSTIYRIED